MNWETAADMATVAAAIGGLIVGLLAYVQYRNSLVSHRENIAQEKLNHLYNLALTVDPQLVDGYFGMTKMPPKNEQEREYVCRYLWLVSAVGSDLEALYLHFNEKQDWNETIAYTLLMHKDFILSDFHRERGWWRTHDPEFTRFIAKTMEIDAAEVEKWAEIQLVPEKFTRMERAGGQPANGGSA